MVLFMRGCEQRAKLRCTTNVSTGIVRPFFETPGVFFLAKTVVKQYGERLQYLLSSSMSVVCNLIFGDMPFARPVLSCVSARACRLLY
jgi:hypothetical protein